MPTNDPYCRIQERGWALGPAQDERVEGETSPKEPFVPSEVEGLPPSEADAPEGGVLGCARTGVSTSLDTNGLGLELIHDPILTPERKLRFLDCLAQHGNVRVAAARVGCSRSGLYLARRRDLTFAAGWRAALCQARDHAQAVLAERALDGVEEQVFYHGEVIATRRRFDTRLLLAHLARLDALCGAEPEAEPFDLALARAAGVDAELPPIDAAAHLDTVAARAGRQFDAAVPAPDPDDPWHYEPVPVDPEPEDAAEDAAEDADEDADEEATDDFDDGFAASDDFRDYDDEGDDEDSYAAQQDRLYDARYEAEAKFEAARAEFVAEAVACVEQELAADHARMLAAVDALRLAPPFEVKSLGAPFAFRTVSSVSSRSGSGQRLPLRRCRVSHCG